MQDLIERTVNYVKRELKQAEGGHDWWHIERVWKTAIHIGKQENVHMTIVELGALLHDIADSKFHRGDEEIGPQKTRIFLEDLSVNVKTVDHVVQIVRNISFKGGNYQSNFSSRELDVVQDADRLDALGAIGIARTFNYGGHKGHELYNPEIPPKLDMTKEEYKNSAAPTINHFYEKLLLLKDRMNTDTGRKMAEERHRFMEEYLDRFYKEWNGEA